MKRYSPGPLAKRVLQGLSLCLNVFFAAYLLTQYWHPRPLAKASDTPPSIIISVAERLPEADAGILWRAYRAKEVKMSAAQQDYRRAVRDTALLLKAPQVDAQGLRVAIDNAKEKRGAVGDLVLEVFIEAFPQMSLPGREKLSEKSQR